MIWANTPGVSYPAARTLPPPLSESERAEIIRLRSLGRTQTDIARAIKRDQSTVSMALIRAGFRTYPKITRKRRTA